MKSKSEWQRFDKYEGAEAYEAVGRCYCPITTCHQPLKKWSVREHLKRAHGLTDYAIDSGYKYLHI